LEVESALRPARAVRVVGVAGAIPASTVAFDHCQMLSWVAINRIDVEVVVNRRMEGGVGDVMMRTLAAQATRLIQASPRSVTRLAFWRLLHRISLTACM